MNETKVSNLSERDTNKNYTNQFRFSEEKLLNMKSTNNIKNYFSFEKETNKLDSLSLSNQISKNIGEGEEEKIENKESFIELQNEEKAKEKNINDKIKKKDKNTQVALINLIRKMRKKNLEIKNNLNNCKYKYEEMNFCLGTKLKYSKWKYEISDYDKYFIDIEHFGEREKKEIERQKTFYDFLEDAVNSVLEKKNDKKYFFQNNKRKKMNEIKNENKIEDKNFPDSEKAKLKQKSVHNSLEYITKRKMAEKVKRSKIKKILRESLNVVI